MSTYQLGQTLQFTLLVTSDGTTLADLGGGDPTATIALPDGTTDTATVTKTATGTYLAAYAADTQVGRYWCTFTGSGTNSGALPYTDGPADVWPANPRMLISLADARAALDVKAANKAPDDELRAICVAATVIVEHEIGPVGEQTKTFTVSGRGQTSIRLPHFPTDVTAVTEDSVSLTAGTGYCWDEAGILYRGSYPGAAAWSASAPRNIAVTYTVGSNIIPAPVIEAGKRRVAHLYGWQQAPRPAFGGQPEMQESFAGMAYRAGYAVPNAVIEMLRPLRSGRMVGLA